MENEKERGGERERERKRATVESIVSLRDDINAGGRRKKRRRRRRRLSKKGEQHVSLIRAVVVVGESEWRNFLMSRLLHQGHLLCRGAFRKAKKKKKRERERERERER